MANLLSLDPVEYGVQQGDLVRFSADGFYWRVDRAVHYLNKIWLTSSSNTGNRKATEAITRVRSVLRDPEWAPEPDNTLEYDGSW